MDVDNLLQSLGDIRVVGGGIVVGNKSINLSDYYLLQRIIESTNNVIAFRSMSTLFEGNPDLYSIEFGLIRNIDSDENDMMLDDFKAFDSDGVRLDLIDVDNETFWVGDFFKNQDDYEGFELSDFYTNTGCEFENFSNNEGGSEVYLARPLAEEILRGDLCVAELMGKIYESKKPLKTKMSM